MKSSLFAFSSFFFSLTGSLCAAFSLYPTPVKAYEFTVDGNGSFVTIWFTDGLGNRTGDPLFEGVLKEGESVKRTTNNPIIQDHSVKERQDNGIIFAWADVFLAGSPGITALDVTAMTPLLRDVDATGGLLNIFYTIDLSGWIGGGGSFSSADIGQVYSDFVGGVSPSLPGFTVGYSTDPTLTIEDAFNIDTLSGSVVFQDALPFNSSTLGSLTATTKQTVAPAPAPAPLPIFAVGAAFGFSRQLRKRIKQSTMPSIASAID